MTAGLRVRTLQTHGRAFAGDVRSAGKTARPCGRAGLPKRVARSRFLTRPESSPVHEGERADAGALGAGALSAVLEPRPGLPEDRGLPKTGVPSYRPMQTGKVAI